MRLSLLVLTVLFGVGCAHSKTTSKLKRTPEEARCATVTSPRDIIRARMDEQRTYLEASDELSELAMKVEIMMGQGLLTRELLPNPLTKEQNDRARDRLRGVRDGLVSEASRMKTLAADVAGTDPLESAPDDIASNPRLNQLQDECLHIRSRAAAERAQSRHIAELQIGEFNAICNDYGLGWTDVRPAS